MPVDVLRCRVCESDYPALANGVCVRCFGPLEPVYDWDELETVVTRARIAGGPGSLWRYADLLPAAPPDDAANGPGLTPLVAAPRLARALGIGEILLKLDLANPTHSFKDRVVAVAAAKATEFGLETLAATSTGNLANAVAARAAATGRAAVIVCPAGLEAEKLRATTVYGATVYAVRGSYDDCSRLVSEVAGEVDWGIVNVNLRSYYAEGSKTLAFEICEQLGWETPDAVVLPIGSGAMFTKVWQGFEQFRRLRPGPRRPPEAVRGAGRGVRARRVGVRRAAPCVAGAARVDRLVDRDRQPGRRRPGDRDRRDVGRVDLRGARGRDRPQHLAARRDGGGVRRGSDRGGDRRPARGGRCAASSGSATGWW